MKLNYTLSKTTIHKTTKKYHLHADGLLLKIWRHIGIEKRMKSHSVPLYNCTLNICLTLMIVLTMILFSLTLYFCVMFKQ